VTRNLLLARDRDVLQVLEGPDSLKGEMRESLPSIAEARMTMFYGSHGIMDLKLLKGLYLEGGNEIGFIA